MKGTYQAEPEQQDHRLLPVGSQVAAEPLARLHRLRTYTYTDPGQTNKQNSSSWVYKGEWNGTVSEKLYLEARYGDFGYYFPLLSNGDENFLFRDTGAELTVLGAERAGSSIATASSSTGAAPTSSTPPARHAHPQGRRRDAAREGWEGYQQRWGGNQETIYANGVPSRCLRLPVGRRSRRLGATTTAIDRARTRRLRDLPERHLERWPSDDERRGPVRQLQGLAAGAGAARRHQRADHRGREGLRRDRS